MSLWLMHHKGYDRYIKLIPLITLNSNTINIKYVISISSFTMNDPNRFTMSPLFSNNIPLFPKSYVDRMNRDRRLEVMKLQPHLSRDNIRDIFSKPKTAMGFKIELEKMYPTLTVSYAYCWGFMKDLCKQEIICVCEYERIEGRMLPYYMDKEIFDTEVETNRLNRLEETKEELTKAVAPLILDK